MTTLFDQSITRFFLLRLQRQKYDSGRNQIDIGIASVIKVMITYLRKIIVKHFTGTLVQFLTLSLFQSPILWRKGYLFSRIATIFKSPISGINDNNLAIAGIYRYSMATHNRAFHLDDEDKARNSSCCSLETATGFSTRIVISWSPHWRRDGVCK